MHTSASSIVSALPWMTCSTFSTMVANRSAKDSAARVAARCLATRECSLLSSRPGPPQTTALFDVRPPAVFSGLGFYGSAVALALAVDIGGTKLAAALVTDEGDGAARAQAPTARGADGEGLFRALLAVVDAVGGNGEVDVCGVGAGGPMTPGGEEVSPLNI